MKTILVTGASGMLGATLVSEWQKVFNVYATGNSNFNNNPAKHYKVFDLKKEKYDELSEWVKPDYILHCAAITNHEYCEKEPKTAILVNGESVKKLLKTFKSSKIIYISTDAVFPRSTHLAKEDDKTKPETVYGKSKELGEKYILKSPRNHLIVRTTIVGKNLNNKKESFAERIVNNLKSGKKVNLFADVFFTPIDIWNFSKELKIIINRGYSKKILHIAGAESSSKFDFGLKLCKILKLNHELIEKSSIDNVKSNIKRSKDQTLSVSLYQKIYKRKLPNLAKVLKELSLHFS